MAPEKALLKKLHEFSLLPDRTDHYYVTSVHYSDLQCTKSQTAVTPELLIAEKQKTAE